MSGRDPTSRAGRFAKGRSGNPAGRPKRPRAPAPSAFDIIIDRTLTITQGGHSREVTIDEALQHTTYQAAIAGSRLAQKAVMKMIERRELARVAKAPPRPGIVVKRAQPEPVNADAALLLLDITQMHTSQGACPAAKLTTWRSRPRSHGGAAALPGRSSMTRGDTR